MAVETRIMNCIMCPLGCEMTVTIEDGAVTGVTGNTCPRGPKYAHDEVVAPKRMLTSTVRVNGGLLPLVPVVSKTTLPKERILDCAAALRQVIVENILGLGVDIVASRSMEVHQE